MRGLRRLTPCDQFSLDWCWGPVASYVCALSVGTAGVFWSQERSSRGSTGTCTWSTASGMASLPCTVGSRIALQDVPGLTCSSGGMQEHKSCRQLCSLISSRVHIPDQPSLLLSCGSCGCEIHISKTSMSLVVASLCWC